MTRPVSLLVLLGCSAFTSACLQGSDAGGERPGSEATGGSTSGTAVDPTTNTPTSTSNSAGTDVTSTSTASTGATSGSADVSSSSDADPGSGGSSSAGATGEPAAICGDGELDPGEACDHGVGNADDAACTLECELAECGDQLIWAGQEACDDGPNNNDNLYGGCTTQCQWGPMCNDGVVQGPEECDLAGDNGSGESPPEGVPCDSGCRFQARLAFLSSATYKAGELGGVEGADIKCQLLADQAGFDNAVKYKAWLSDGQHSPDQDFVHTAETANLPYVRPDGVRIADDWDDLTQNGLLEGIIVTETGEKVPYARVWTGTTPSGKVFDPDATCEAWSDSFAIPKARLGLSGVDKQPEDDWTKWLNDREWTNHDSELCLFSYRIYCFEQ